MVRRIIDLQHIKKSFGEQQVLDDISFSVTSGEIVALLGPSGAGKSTVIKLMLGMEKSDSGVSEIFEKPMPNRQLLGRIGYMAQSDALYEQLTGQENLLFFAEMKAIKKSDRSKAIKHVADVVDLGPFLTKKVSGYSGGMKRRLSLAIALLGKPDLLVLDEPTVGIDPALRRKIWRELYAERDSGTSILLTTHVMDEAEWKNRVVLLLDGRLIADAPPKKLLEDYQVSNLEDVFLKAEGELQ